jgi:hypothetical protein
MAFVAENPFPHALRVRAVVGEQDSAHQWIELSVVPGIEVTGGTVAPSGAELDVAAWGGATCGAMQSGAVGVFAHFLACASVAFFTALAAASCLLFSSSSCFFV